MSPERFEAGQRALAERARRVTAIRRRIAAAAVGAFALAWGLIAATGSMGSQAVATASATTAAQPGADGSSSSTTTRSASADDGRSLPAVGTAQS